MEEPLVSVLIANYKNGRFFLACFERIKKQTYEVNIVDDKSTANTII